MCLQKIRCIDILSDRRNPEDEFTGVEMLAESIRLHGVLRPVVVRPTEEGYVLVHGERRLRAARAAGLEAIPAYLVDEVEQGA